MKWEYTEKPCGEILWEVMENGRRLFLVYRAGRPPDIWSRCVWDGPYNGCEVEIDPSFQLCIPDCDSNPLPVFVYQERPCADNETLA
jgi:hypothetical protein